VSNIDEDGNRDVLDVSPDSGQIRLCNPRYSHMGSVHANGFKDLCGYNLNLFTGKIRDLLSKAVTFTLIIIYLMSLAIRFL